MDGTTFDRLVQSAIRGSSRRNFLTSAGAAALAGFGFSSLFGVDEADARRRKRKKKGKKGKRGSRAEQRCLNAGAPCITSDQCCPGKTKRICEVPFNGSNSDTYCCGAEGAPCGGFSFEKGDIDPVCCVGFFCSSETDAPGVCIRDTPPEL